MGCTKQRRGLHVAHFCPKTYGADVLNNRFVRFKTKQEKISVSLNYYTTAIYYRSLSVECLWPRIRWHCIGTLLSILVLVVASWRLVFCPPFDLLLDLICFIMEKVLAHTYVLLNIDYILVQNLSVWEIYLCWLIFSFHIPISLMPLILYVDVVLVLVKIIYCNIHTILNQNWKSSWALKILYTGL